MNTSFRLFPHEASTMAGRVDALYLFLLLVSGFVTVLVASLILYFAIRYQKRLKANRANPPESWKLEIGWSVVPLVLSLVMYAWGAELFVDMRQIPPGADEYHVVAKQWMWKIQHPDGRREINQLHVPLGRPVKLKMISEDVIHSFFVPDFRVKQDVLPGRYTTMWFQPTRVGTYHLFCAEYCGTSHSRMVGEVIVMKPADYEDWLSGASDHQPAEVVGERLFLEFRCNTCHKPHGRCPPLDALVGSTVQLSDGRKVVADDAYLRESILDPKAKVVAGFQPVMPTFQGQIGEEGILQIIAYLKTLSPKSPGDATSKSSQTKAKP